MQLSQQQDRPFRIAIHCKQRLLRDALANCLSGNPEFTVVGHIADIENLIELCALSRPDVVLFDADNGLPDGLDALRVLRVRFPGTQVVLAYDRLSPNDLAVAVRAGVDTLIPYSHGLDALFAVLRYCIPAADRGKEALSDMDREILALVGTGHSVDRIATLLQVSKATVENHKRRIYHKLYVSGQNQAMARATTLGLLGRPTVGGDGANPPGTARGDSYSGLPDLTVREGDILRSIARGHTVRQTARILGIAEKTVENIQTRLFRKLGVHNRPAALTVADALGLIDPADD